MKANSLLFSPYRLKGMDLKNRIVMSPMLMYQAHDDGSVTERQVLHYGARALGGVALIMTEVVAVHPLGRISESDIGLWSDEHIAGIRRIVEAVHACDAKIGVQLAHAGRKANLPGGCVAPSPIPHSEDSPTPAELTTAEVRQLVQHYGAAAARADQAGVDCIQIHAAHGYLVHEFLAPMSNERTDEYGGSLENRARFLLEVVRTVRAALPPGKPLLVRFSGTDLVDGGVTADDAVQLAKWLEAAGADFLEVTTGNITKTYTGEIYPGYQAKFVQDVRRHSALPLGSVGSIHSADLAEYLLRDGGIDLVFIGRALLRDPFWPIHAASDMGSEPPLPIPTYARASGPYQRGF
ncbi:tRNA-dihydrouridine synthase [Arthrobacter sp. NPDC093139]|uniref:oxidoreductase n=1 Tax=Arthrobacter sp. NPDC093139 TaxID=3363945 RepID=UPI0037F8BAA3